MDQTLKKRLIGASVLVALAVIFIPMLVSKKPQDEGQSVSISIPDEPADLKRKRIQLDKPQLPSEEQLDLNRESDTTSNSIELSNNDSSLVSDNLVDNKAGLEAPIVIDKEAVEERLTTPIKTVVIEDQTPITVDPEPQITEKEETKQEVVNTPTPKPVIEKVIDKVIEPISIPVKTPEITESATPEKTGLYQVKIGSFSKKTNAEQLKSKVIHAGLNANVYLDEKRNLHSVVSELFSTRSQAIKYNSELSKLGLKIGKTSVQEITSVEQGLINKSLVNGFVVQMGSFSSLKNAKTLREDLRKKNFVSFIDEVKGANGKSFRVRVGPFVEEKDAKANQTKIQRELNKKGIIKPHEHTLVIE